jgi:sterol-4alpha-carboxylate 3-dehydrogenase (decarboxylating)
MVSQNLSPVLITGGCGFIGYHLVQHILVYEPNCRIHVLDIDTSRNRVQNAIYHTCDIASASAVDEVLQQAKPRTVFHIASPDHMVLNDKQFEAVNVGGTRHLLSSTRKLGTVQALVFTNSSSVIHDNVTDLLDADETLPVLCPPVQKSAYTLTKAAAEKDILAANRRDGEASLLTCSLRPCTAIGERDTICLGKMLAVAEQGQTRFQMGNGKNVYDFIYVGNLVDAHILTARHLLAAYGKPPPPAEKRVDGECFNITNDERVLFWDFTRQIAAAGGYPVKQEEIVVVPVWVALLIGWISEWIVWMMSRGTRQPNMTVEGIRYSTIHRTLNVEKAKRVLGYKPRVELDEGIRRGAEWWKENRKVKA